MPFKLFRTVVSGFSFAVVVLAGVLSAEASPTLAAVKGTGAATPFQLQISGSPTDWTVIQASSDFRNWTDIQTNPPGAQFTVVDWQSPNFRQRFYRAVAVISATSLPDLSEALNAVFPVNEGFNTVQFAPDGRLGFIAWRNRDLIYRERSVSGVWSESVISSSGSLFQPRQLDEYRFQPFAAILFDSASRAHVLRLEGQTVHHHLRQASGWTEIEQINAPGASSYALMATAIGAGDKLHIALIGSGSSPNLVYGSNRNGGWSWSTVTGIAGDPRGFLRQSWAPRFFSLAVDSQNYAHIAFTPEFRITYPPPGYARPYSELAYASNRSGQWQVERVDYDPDGSGDAGTGASIAIGPDDQPAIAAWYNERADTGSAQWSQLRYHHRDANGNWSDDHILSSPAGYSAGDGDKGTGFAPYLRFDRRGRPNIFFSDHAAQHFPYQNEFAGQLRHGYFDGASWVFRTVYQQSDPLQKQMIYPGFGVSDAELFFIGLERQTQWIDYRTANSTYRFVSGAASMP